MTSPRHHYLEDAQALLTGTLLFALAILILRQAGLLTGGTAGVAFLAHYTSGVSFATTIGSATVAPRSHARCIEGNNAISPWIGQ